MDVELAPELQELRQSVRRFVTNELEPLARQMDETNVAPPELVSRLREGGFLGMRLSEEHGGRGRRPLYLLPDHGGAEPQPSLLHPCGRLFERADAVPPSPSTAPPGSKHATCQDWCKAAPAPPSR